MSKNSNFYHNFLNLGHAISAKHKDITQILGFFVKLKKMTHNYY